MEGLMRICNYWGSTNCHPEIKKFGSIREKKPGKKFMMLPVGENANKFDEICRKCKIRLFEIKEMKCPVCENEELPLSTIVDIEYEFGTLKGNLYICDNCNTKLLSDKIF